MRQFFEAFAYFVESGLPEKLAKEFAEKITGIKAPTGKIDIPKTKSPDEFRMPKAADDVIEANDNVSGNYATGDTKYNADVLAEELAKKRGFIKDDGIQDGSDMDVKKYSELYSEAYGFLTDLRRLNRPVKRADIPKKLLTRKERGNFNFINSKMPDPQKSKFVLEGLDGTTEGLYNRFRLERDAIEEGMVKQIKEAQSNNLALGGKDMDNIIYNMKIFKNLDDKVKSLGVELSDAGKEPEKLYEMFKADVSNKPNNIQSNIFDDYKGILGEMDVNIKKMQKISQEIDDIRSGKADIDRKNKAKLKYQGKGYGSNEGMFRTLARQFLRDEIESGTISVRPDIYNAMKQGNHPFIDPIKVFRHHYGDDKFDVLEKYIDQNYPAFGSPGLRYPGRFDFRKRGIVPKNKNAPGNTYEHYSLPGELDQEIADVDNVIKTIEEGNNPFFKGPEDIKNQNIKRANLVKIKNEITPASKIDLTKYSNDDLNRLADEGNRLQKELAQLDETGSSKISYQEFQKKSARLDEINEIIEEAKSMPEEYFDQQPTADVIPIKQEGIISNLDLNIDRGVKNLEGVELYGDETFDELKYIKENGVHPRDLDPTEGFARGGIVEVLI